MSGCAPRHRRGAQSAYAPLTQGQVLSKPPSVENVHPSPLPSPLSVRPLRNRLQFGEDRFLLRRTSSDRALLKMSVCHSFTEFSSAKPI